MKVSRFLPVVLALVLFSCAPAAPRPDASATEAAIAARIFATLTAAAPAVATTAPATTLPRDTLAPPTPAAASIDTPIPPTPAPAPLATATPKSFATVTPIPADSSLAPEAIVTGASLNVRVGPGTSHPVIAVLKKGQVVPVAGRDDQGGWLAIQLPDGSTGWVSRSLLQLNPAAESIAVAGNIPTAPAPAPPSARAPAPGKKSLEVVFMNPHYECQKIEWISLVRVWGYRSFQADMFIKNNSQAPIQPPWKPQRWIITDGANERVSDLIWEWGHVQTGLFNQPIIAPGQSAGWTFMAFPIERNEWVKAAEFVWQGQVYRTEFDLGTFGNAHNYKDCGEYPATTGPRVPVPVDTPVGPGQPGGPVPTAPPPRG